MPTFTIRLVCEAGFGPLGEGPFERIEELVEVEAPTLWRAYRTATRKMTISPRGRLLVGYDAETGERAEPPALSRELRAAKFTVDGLEDAFEGYTIGETWNGWAVPAFPLSEAHRIATAYAAQAPLLEGACEAEYDEQDDSFRFYDPVSGEWDEWAGEERDGQKLYPIGARYWTWEEIGVPAS